MQVSQPQTSSTGIFKFIERTNLLVDFIKNVIVITGLVIIMIVAIKISIEISKVQQFVSTIKVPKFP